MLAENSATLAASASTITLAGIFRRSARLFADRVAVVGPDHRLTYRELDERSTRLANALTGAGIPTTLGSSDRAGPSVLAPNEGRG